jgi:hypothetical protein
LRQSEYDVMVTSHHPCLSDEMLSLRSEAQSLLEPCEVEFEVQSLRAAIDLRLMDSQSLRNRLTTLEELDERRQMGA